MKKPTLPIPAPLRGTDPGSFAQNTVRVRLANIARRTLAENDFAAPARLQALIDELPDGRIRPLHDDAPDTSAWVRYVRPYAGLNWLQAPWFFAETYFYRRILEAADYFGAGPDAGVDPYLRQKQLGLAAAERAIDALCARVDEWLTTGRPPEQALADLLEIDLWGNQADLSLWPAGEQGADDRPKTRGAGLILVNQAAETASYLTAPARSGCRVDIVVDNAGFELVCDLLLAGYLLAADIAAEVRCHVKSHPTFVSDAMVKDVRSTIQTLAASPHPATRVVGRRLQGFWDAGRLRAREDWYWTSPLSFWEAPQPVFDELAPAALIISKGDANYRRLLGDRHWSYTTPFADIMAYAPAPLIAVRVLKSEVAAGLHPVQIGPLFAEDPAWLTNGTRGVIQGVGIR